MSISKAKGKTSVEERVETYINNNDFTGSLTEIRSRMDRWEEQYGDGLFIKADYGWDGDVDYSLWHHREETDEEYEERQAELLKRAKIAAKRKATMAKKAEDKKRKAEEAERALYEQLKEKYDE